MNGHGDGAAGGAVGKVEAVWVGDGDGEGAVEGGSRRGREVAEGEEVLSVGRIKEAKVRVVFDSCQDMEEWFFGY